MSGYRMFLILENNFPVKQAENTFLF